MATRSSEATISRHVRNGPPSLLSPFESTRLNWIDERNESGEFQLNFILCNEIDPLALANLLTAETCSWFVTSFSFEFSVKEERRVLFFLLLRSGPEPIIKTSQDSIRDRFLWCLATITTVITFCTRNSIIRLRHLIVENVDVQRLELRWVFLLFRFVLYCFVVCILSNHWVGPSTSIKRKVVTTYFSWLLASGSKSWGRRTSSARASFEIIDFVSIFIFPLRSSSSSSSSWSFFSVSPRRRNRKASG